MAARQMNNAACHVSFDGRGSSTTCSMRSERAGSNPGRAHAQARARAPWGLHPWSKLRARVHSSTSPNSSACSHALGHPPLAPTGHPLAPRAASAARGRGVGPSCALRAWCVSGVEQQQAAAAAARRTANFVRLHRMQDNAAHGAIAATRVDVRKIWYWLGQQVHAIGRCVHCWRPRATRLCRCTPKCALAGCAQGAGCFPRREAILQLSPLRGRSTTFTMAAAAKIALACVLATAWAAHGMRRAVRG